VPPTVISADGSYEWDKAKDLTNRRDHRCKVPGGGVKPEGVGFAEAASVLDYPHTVVIPDGGGMGALRGIGFSRRGRMLTVVFEPRGERDHIISAWCSTPDEKRRAGSDGGRTW
jgi:uncharacterized DUF497 family protein